MKDKQSPSSADNKESTRPTPFHSPRVGKVIVPDKTEKKFQVIVHYLPVTEEEARIKKAIIQRIMTKTPPK